MEVFIPTDKHGPIDGSLCPGLTVVEQLERYRRGVEALLADQERRTNEYNQLAEGILWLGEEYELARGFDETGR